MTALTLHGFSPSTYTQTAMLVATEAGVPFELAPLEFKKASHFAMHPYGKMPVLRHGEVTLFETLAIATYLDEELGGRSLQPDAALDRARMNQWISVAVDYGYAALVGSLHDDEPSSDAVAEAGKQLKLLDAGLGDAPFFSGKSLGLADLFLYPMVRFARAKLGERALERLPELKAWYARISDRPSVGALDQ